jgi:hypothetical protein
MVSYQIYPSSFLLSQRMVSLILLLCCAGYIGEFECVDDHRAGKIVVELNGRLNKCGVISPRFDVGVNEIEGWTARLLPSRQVFAWRRYRVQIPNLYTADLLVELINSPFATCSLVTLF